MRAWDSLHSNSNPSLVLTLADYHQPHFYPILWFAECMRHFNVELIDEDTSPVSGNQSQGLGWLQPGVNKKPKKFIFEYEVFSKTRPRSPWHVGPLKVGLLAVNTPQNPPEPQAHQTRGPTTRPTAHQIHWTTRPTSPPDNGPIRPTGPTTHRPMVKNSEKL